MSEPSFGKRDASRRDFACDGGGAEGRGSPEGEISQHLFGGVSLQ